MKIRKWIVSVAVFLMIIGAFSYLAAYLKWYQINTIEPVNKPIATEQPRIDREEVMDSAWKSIRQLDYKGAAEKLLQVKDQVSQNDTEYQSLLNTCQRFQKLVPYEGPVEHIFFHQLIAYPELLYDGDSQQKGFDEYYATVKEFKRCIQQLYDKNYIMVNINSLFHVGKGGKVKQNKLKLPKGKKPFVLSMDDYSFSTNKKANGTVHGFTFDEQGNIITFTDKNGKRMTSDDNEVVPIIDRFVREHPDFTFGGAKGLFALTGCTGVLGLPTNNVHSKKHQEYFDKTKKIVDRLKETGWYFGSHSYWHGSPAMQTDHTFFGDVNRWKKEVGAILGETKVYVLPFGEQISPSDPKFKYLLKSGFKMICGVGPRPYLYFGSKYILMDRRNIDGISLRDDRLKDLFNVSKIIDSVRPGERR